MRPPFLVTASLPRHGDTDSRGTNLGVVAFCRLNILPVEVSGSIASFKERRLISIISILGRVIIVTIDDSFTWLAYFDIACLTEQFT
jgi:hypothetical protein